MMKTRSATCVAVLAPTARTPKTTAEPTNLNTAAPAPPPPLRLGPASALANINLPDGSTLVASHPPTTLGDPALVNDPSAPYGPGKWRQSDESWHYTVPYDSAVSVMRDQLGSAVRVPDGVWINGCS